MNQRDRLARTIQHPNGARVTFVHYDYLQLLAQLLKWLYAGTMIESIEEEAAIMKLFEPPPPLHDDDYVYPGNDITATEVSGMWGL